ncbi:hypothetical protein NMY22_g5262 [Coprinellus aureogranulatus]|nr:hypothetical protein NMY22_g5262 [Coprinellus aureogranulatus]
MTKLLPSLIIAADVGHSKVRRGRRKSDENSLPGHPGKSGGLGSTLTRARRHGSAMRSIRSGEFKAPSVQDRKRGIMPQARVPLAPITPNDGVTTTMNDSAIPEHDSDSCGASIFSPSSPVQTPPSAQVTLPGTPSREPSNPPDNRRVPRPLPGSDLSASDKVARMKTSADAMERKIEDLEDLVGSFRRKLKRVSVGFMELRYEVDHVSQQFEALEEDHFNALENLDKGRIRCGSYIEKLRIAEKELDHIHQAHPELMQDVCQDSQIKSWSPIYKVFQ